MDNKQVNLLALASAGERADKSNTEENAVMSQRDTLGSIQQSMLSPKRQENQDVKQDDYVSPFSDEFWEKTQERDKEFEDEQSQEGAVSSNRIQAYLMLAAVLYVIALIVGYHNTTYTDGVPQVVTKDVIDGRKYLADANEYLDYIQTSHVESVEAVEDYTADLMSASELSSLMKKKNEELEKKYKEVEDMFPPADYDMLHEGLQDMYTTQISMNSAAINYAARKNDDTFVVLENINTRYEDRSEAVIEMYDEAFQR